MEDNNLDKDSYLEQFHNHHHHEQNENYNKPEWHELDNKQLVKPINQ